MDGIIPHPEVRLMRSGLREAYTDAGFEPPQGCYIPPTDERDGCIEIKGVLGAQPDVLGHEALHHVLYHLEGAEVSQDLDNLPLDQKPMEVIDNDTLLLTRQAIQDAHSDLP